MSGPMQWTPRGMVPALSLAATGTRVERTDDDADDEDLDDEGGEPASHGFAAPPAAGKKRQAPRVDPAPPNVLKLARERLRYVEREIKRLKKLEVERDELRRLLDAAKTKPRAVVRELPTKRTAG